MSRVLVAGLGSIGRRHARNLAALGVADLAFLRRREEKLAELPEAPVFTSLDSALDWGPEAVVICTPAPWHLEMARAAIRRGCALFVEKPLAAAWDGVPELLQDAAAFGVQGMLGFDLRFDPGLIRAHELVAAGVLGRLVSVEAVVGQYLPEWRPTQDYRAGVTARAALGGGVLLELCHELDTASWMAGRVATIACEAGRLSDLEMDVEDTAALLLRFEGGALGTVLLDCVRRPATRTLRLVGERGSLCWDGLARTVEWWTEGTSERQRFDFGSTSREDRLRSEMACFLELVTGRAQAPVDLRAGAEVLRLVLAAKRSAELGRRLAPSEIGELPS